MVGAEDHALYAAAQVRIVQHHLMRADPASAMHYASRLDDTRWLVRLLCEHGIGLLATGHRAVVARALAAVPDHLESEVPAVTAIRALERRLAHDHAAAVRLATDAIRAADTARAAEREDGPGRQSPWVPDQFDRTLLEATLILRCWLARIGVGSHTDAVAPARRGLGCAGQSSSRHRHAAQRGDLDAANATRGWLLSEVAICETWLGDLASARVHTEAALGTARASGSDRQLAVGLAHLSVIEWAAGNLPAADVHAREAILIAESSGGARDSFVARARVVVAWVAMQRLDFAVTDAELALARDYLEREHDSFVLVAEHLMRGYLLVHDGELVQARAHLETFPTTVEPPPMFVQAHLTTLRSWCAVAAGDLDGIDAEITQLEALDLGSQADIVRAVALDIRGRTDDALALLARLTAANNPLVANPTPAIAASAYRAWLLAREGQRTDAQAQVRDLLATMTPHQRLFVSGVATTPLIVDLLTDQATSDQLQPAAVVELEALLDAPNRVPSQLPNQAGPIALETAPPPTPEPVIDLRDRPRATARRSSEPILIDGGLVVDLTARERDVLHELALGGSYADIAQVLYITENTVKTHLASLYRKLGATRRADALRSARQAGLLDS
jgi:ATP/maltotriose-dependent transcriptional regulator MalT